MTAKRYIIGIFIILISLYSNFVSAQTFNLSTDDLSCIAGRGRIIVNVTSGSSPYDYYLFDGNPFAGGNLLDSELGTTVSSHIFADWPAATYWIAVAATEGTLVQSIVLSTVQSQALSVPVITVVSGPTCINSTDASLEATVTGGNPPYTYTWSPNTGSQTTKIATGLGQGTYKVTVNDSYNCGLTNERVKFYYYGIDPSIPDSLNAGQIGGANSICVGGNPTTITEVNPPSGGSGGYTYSWEYQNNCSGAWTLIPGANGPEYDPPAGLMQTRCYHRIVSNTCGVVISNAVTVTVNPLPLPTISGPTPACQGSTGNTYTTQAGNSNYTWIVSAGGSITAGGSATDNFVTVTWNNSGAQSVSVNYQNSFGCTAVSPTVYNVTVNAAPSPSLNGPSPVCAGTTGNVYTTDGGMTNYTWVVSAGGTITSGGGASDNTVTVTWNTAGARSVSINYTNANGCRALIPTVLPVTVNPLPVPTLNGPTPVCVNSTGNVYTTEAGMSNYVWTVSPGGTITGGGGAANNTVTISWNSTGAQWVRVSYTNGNGCTASTPTQYNITVNPLPVPSIGGPTPVCVSSTGNIYTTEPGMSNYVWIVSAGGTITGGGGATNNTVTVTWNATGAQSISVSYTNTNGCTAAAPTVYPVTVNPLPVPTIGGPTPVCANSTGNVYTTEAGMSNYVWTVSAGGTITSGGGATNNTVTITWNTAGARSVSVSYTNGNGCTSAAPTVYPVTVNPLPVPIISGPTPVCVGDIETYTTDAGMSNYIWTVPSGGSITAGGGASDDFATVTWTIAGARSVRVRYTDGNGCTTATPTIYPVTVNSLPVPTLNGPNSVCVNSTGNVYTTQAGMSNYVWTVSAGGTITSGGGATNNTVTVTWNAVGPQSVSVSYTNTNGCTAAVPAVRNVTVNPLPVPTIGGPTPVCVNSTGNIYTTESGMSNYVWTVSAGGSITAGGGAANNSVTITWNAVGPQSVSVSYTNANGCIADVPTVYPVNVDPLPVPTISGPTPVCAGSTGNVYSTEAGMSNYVWTISAGGSITSGGGATNSTVTVTWNTAGARSVSVRYTNTNGCTAVIPTVYPVTVNPRPLPLLNGPTPVCLNSTGNTYSTDAGMSNYSWTVSAGGSITGGGGINDNSVVITWNTTGAQNVRVGYTDANGCTSATPTILPVTVNPLPVPTISGPDPVCLNSTGNTYTTESGMSAYNWVVSAGGTITNGGSAADDFVEITWNAAGARSVSISYTNGNGCTAAAPTVMSVTVNPLPVPTLNGPNPVCVNSTGNVYTTDAGMTSYVWTVSAGGTITAGGGATNNTATITWNTTGAQSVSVSYTDANGCIAGGPSTLPVTVNPLPVPTIIGPSPVCEGSTGNTYTTEVGMTNYTWAVSAGGTITSGGGVNDNSVVVTWNTAGAGNVRVSYTNASGCISATPTVLPITVNPLPIPSLNGPTSVCVNTTGNTYTTDAGMSNYTWIVSGGGAITNGGGIGDDFVEITWNTVGAQSVSISFTDANGCTSSVPTVLNVTVNPLPVPIINGPTPVCENSTGNTYTTEAGMSNYIWTVSGGGTITSGGGATNNTVTVTWNTVGPQWVSVNYTNTNGCTSVLPIVFPVIVDPQPVPILFGPLTACEGTAGNLYVTDGGMSNYIWTISPGGTITNGGGVNDNTVEITWNTPGTESVSINYTDASGCNALIPTSINVNVIAAPIIVAGTNATICNGDNYAITGASVLNVTDFSWRSSGTGTFDDPDIIDPVYSPSLVDQQNGSVTIYLDAVANAPCLNVTDSFVLTIPPPVQPAIGAPAPFVIGPNTEVEVCLATSGHAFIVDMGYYLVAPDGNTVFTLKKGPMEVDFFNPCLPFPPPPGDLDTLCFTTELPLTDTLDVCSEPRPIDGTFAATGDWSLLYGMNPSEGGWSVMIKDTANNMGGIDGAIVYAAMSFADTATATGLFTTVDYYSGTVNIPILEPANTSYIIPRALRESCPGACDAIAIVNTLGGTPPYVDYNWSPVPTGGNGTDSVLLCAGTYNLTVTDALGCTGTTSVDVISPPAINIDAVTYTDTINCYGDSDGFISVVASGGTGKLSFTLLPGTPSETADSGYFSGLSVGTYTVRIEDIKGCYIDTTFTIYQPQQLVLESAAVTDSVFCTGDTNGRIVAAASGGTEPYSFILEPLAIVNDSGIFDNLAPGSYLVRVTDANSCDTLDSDTLILGIPIPLAIDTVIVNPIVCNGGNGAMTVVTIGGRAPYDIYVNGLLEESGVADTSIILRGPGNYDIFVEDANGCTYLWAATISLVDPPVLQIDDITLTPITGCYTDSTGEILVTASGGVPPLAYALNGGSYQLGNFFDKLTGGNYTIYVRDNLGCVHTKDTTMISPPLLLGNPFVTNIQGDNPGSILMNPSGGIPYSPPDQYRYSIDGGSLTTNPLFEDLPVGNYLMHVEDSVGCSWDSIVSVMVLDLDVDVLIIDAECYGSATGEIRIWMNDGIPPYLIMLGSDTIYTNVNDNFRTIPSRYAGDYLLRVEDATTRRFDTLITIGEPDPIIITKSSTQPTCHEYELDGSISTDGSISYNSTGGSGGFTYSWTDSNTSDSVRNELVVGTYIVAVSDRNGCTIYDTTNFNGQVNINAGIAILPNPNLGPSPPVFRIDTTVCYLTQWDLVAFHSESNVAYEWNPDTLLDDPSEANSDEVSLTVRGNNIFSVKISTDRCFDNDQITINMFDTIGMHITTDAYRVADTIYSPELKPMNLYSSDGFTSYFWFGDVGEFDNLLTQNTVLSPLANQRVSITGQTFDGCNEYDTVFVLIQQTIEDMYTVFTPNNDGFNDYWTIPHALQYPDIEVYIFNRWGQQIFYSKTYGVDQYNTWDGKSQKSGKDLPVGTYYYVIKPNDGEQEPITGTVTIVR